MSDRPTPETDTQIKTFTSVSKLKKSFENRTGTVSAAFARKLERERDEAREALRTLAEHGESEIQRVTKERDEAIADLEFRRGLYKVLEGANNHLMTANQEVAKLARTLKQERDEARSLTEHQWLLKVGSRLVQAGCKSDGITESLDEIIRERDEARAERDILRSNKMSDPLLETTFKHLNRERDEACQVANGLAKQAERLRKERDQLKEALLIMENLLKPGIELFPEIGEILKGGVK